MKNVKQHNIPLSVTHNFNLGDDVYMSRAIPRVEVCIKDDLLCTDGRTTVVIKDRGAGVYQALTGTYEKGSVREQTIGSNKTMVTHRELQQSRGFLQVNDVKFRLSDADTDWEPEQGDILTDLKDQRRYDIIAVDTQVLATQILCWCRSV